MSIAIKVEGLTKSYSSNTVIKDLSFDVNEGEIFALLGVNGAGKTTTLDCIEGLKKYDSGSITVNGTMGVQLQSTSLPTNMKPLEVMKLFSKWNKTPFDESLVEIFDISVLADKQYKQLSTGQKRRLHLALSLIGDPDFIFLDEPTAGLDVESRARLHDEIRKLKAKGKTIVMASHDMAEVESLCDRIAILKDGVFAFIGTANELTRKASKQATIFIKTLSPLKMKEIDSCQYQGQDRGYDVFLVQNLGDVLFEILAYAKKTDNVVVDVRVEKSTLEQRFIDIAKKEEAS